MKRTPIRRRSPNKARDDARLQAAKNVVRARSNGVCELQTAVCAGRAVHVHHLLPRSQGGNRHLPDLMADTCLPCHGYTHAHPAEAYAHGWLLRSTYAREAKP